MTDERLEEALRRQFAGDAPGYDDTGHALARYVSGDMSEAEAEAFAARLASDPQLQSELYEFEQSAATWQAAEGAPEQGFAAWWRRLWRPTAGVLALATSAAILLFALRSGDDLGGLQPKGIWQLHVAVERGGKVERLDDQPLGEGDRLGFFYSSEQPGYLMVLYLDTEAPATRIFPAASETAAKVAPGQEVRLADGAVVGEPSECEWLVGLFSGQPFDSDQATELLAERVKQRDGCHLGPGPRSQPIVSQVVELRRQ